MRQSRCRDRSSSFDSVVHQGLFSSNAKRCISPTPDLGPRHPKWLQNWANPENRTRGATFLNGMPVLGIACHEAVISRPPVPRPGKRLCNAVLKGLIHHPFVSTTEVRFQSDD